MNVVLRKIDREFFSPKVEVCLFEWVARKTNGPIFWCCRFVQGPEPTKQKRI